LPDLREPLRSAVAAEAARRAWEAPARQPETHGAPALQIEFADVGLLRAIVDAGYCILARQHHPDAGVMRRPNAQAGSLRSQLAALEGGARL
jgi:hypothetical protein